MPFFLTCLIREIILTVPSILNRKTSASSSSSKTVLFSTLLVCLFVASSWNLMSFSKIRMRFGGISTPQQSSDASATTPTDSSSPATATVDPATSTVTMSSDQALKTMGSAIGEAAASDAIAKPSKLSAIEEGIRTIANTGFDPFSISLVNPNNEIKKSELESLSPFYQLLITQNKEVKLTEPPPEEKPKVDPTVVDASAGGVAVETIPVAVNPIDDIKLTGISYMPKHSFAMLNVSGQANQAIVAQGQVLSVGGQQVKVVSIGKGSVSLCWVGSPKGVSATQQLTMPNIIGYQSTAASSGSSSKGGASADTAGSPTSGGGMPPTGGGSSSSSGGGKGNATPPSNTPEAIEKLVNDAMKP
jgi:hypothetical protein